MSGERAYRLAGLPAPVPVGGLSRVFRGCHFCSGGLTVRAKVDSLDVECRSCGSAWTTWPSGRITNGRSGSLFFAAAFSRGSREGARVLSDEPVKFEDLVELRDAWEAR